MHISDKRKLKFNDKEDLELFPGRPDSNPLCPAIYKGSPPKL